MRGLACPSTRLSFHLTISFRSFISGHRIIAHVNEIMFSLQGPGSDCCPQASLLGLKTAPIGWIEERRCCWDWTVGGRIHFDSDSISRPGFLALLQLGCPCAVPADPEINMVVAVLPIGAALRTVILHYKVPLPIRT